MENLMLLHRKEGLVLTTIDVINECGIQAVSTKEIARRQGVSEATIFKHFKTKSELMMAVLNHFSQYDHAIVQSIEATKLKPTEAVIYFFESYATYYENYPAITAIEHTYDVLQCDAELSGKVKDIFTFRYEFINRLVMEAQKAGEIRREIDSEQLADTLIGAAREICLKWRMSKYNFPLKEKSLSTLRMILNLSTTVHS